MGKVWRRRWVDDDFRWVTWRSRFFSIFKKVWGTNPLTTLSGQLWALDPCRPEGTEGVHAFKTQLLRAKREGSNLNHSVCLFIEETRAFCCLCLWWAFDQVTFGLEACCKLGCLGYNTCSCHVNWQLEGPGPGQFNWQALLSSSILSALLPRQFWHRRHGIHSEVPWPWHSRSFAGGHVLVQPLDTLSCDDCDGSVIQ